MTYIDIWYITYDIHRYMQFLISVVGLKSSTGPWTFRPKSTPFNFNMEHSSLFFEHFGLCLETNLELIFQKMIFLKEIGCFCSLPLIKDWNISTSSHVGAAGEAEWPLWISLRLPYLATGRWSPWWKPDVHHVGGCMGGEIHTEIHGDLRMEARLGIWIIKW